MAGVKGEGKCDALGAVPTKGGFVVVVVVANVAYPLVDLKFRSFGGREIEKSTYSLSHRGANGYIPIWVGGVGNHVISP